MFRTTTIFAQKKYKRTKVSVGTTCATHVRAGQQRVSPASGTSKRTPAHWPGSMQVDAGRPKITGPRIIQSAHEPTWSKPTWTVQAVSEKNVVLVGQDVSKVKETSA